MQVARACVQDLYINHGVQPGYRFQADRGGAARSSSPPRRRCAAGVSSLQVQAACGGWQLVGDLRAFLSSCCAARRAVQGRLLLDARAPA
jgi:hypothetical protein